MKAKRKPLNIINASDFKISPNSEVCISSLRLQSGRTAGSILKNVDELLDKIGTQIKSL